MTQHASEPPAQLHDASSAMFAISEGSSSPSESADVSGVRPRTIPAPWGKPGEAREGEGASASSEADADAEASAAADAILRAFEESGQMPDMSELGVQRAEPARERGLLEDLVDEAPQKSAAPEASVAAEPKPEPKPDATFASEQASEPEPDPQPEPEPLRADAPADSAAEPATFHDDEQEREWFAEGDRMSDRPEGEEDSAEDEASATQAEPAPPEPSAEPEPEPEPVREGQLSMSARAQKKTTKKAADVDLDLDAPPRKPRFPTFGKWVGLGFLAFASALGGGAWSLSRTREPIHHLEQRVDTMSHEETAARVENEERHQRTSHEVQSLTTRVDELKQDADRAKRERDELAKEVATLKDDVKKHQQSTDARMRRLHDAVVALDLYASTGVQRDSSVLHR